MLNRFTSNTKRLNRIVSKVNINNLTDASITGSLENIIADGIESPKKFEANVKSNPSPIKIISTKNHISNFYTNIIEYSGQYIYTSVSHMVKEQSIDGESVLKKLILGNTKLKYGTEEVGPENFEVLIDGLHLPGIFSVKQIGLDVEIILNELWKIDDRVEPDSVIVFGKIDTAAIITEEGEYIITEDEQNIIKA